MADFFDTFKARVKQGTEADQEQVANELADLDFESGQHWSDQDVIDRKLAGKPSLTFDLLSPPIKQVTNAQRVARPGITIRPVGNGADVDQAERWQGVIRRIERLSQATRVYAWAGQHQVKMGRGFWILRNVEVGEDGEQDIRIEEVENQHAILCDPGTKKLDGSDKRWAIYFQDLTHDEYRDRFGESKLAASINAGRGFTAGEGDMVPLWLGSKTTRIAEYWYLEETTRTRLILDDGARVFEDELPTVPARVKGKFAKVPQIPEGRTVVKRVNRPTKIVHWCLLNAAGEHLVPETVIPGELIPVVMIYGERRFLRGKRDFRGMVRMNKDASRTEDWAESSLMEAISHAKTAPWLMAVGQADGLEAMWSKANTNPPQALQYNPIDVNGHPVERPTRVSSGVDVSALTLAAQRMQNHVKQNTGMADVYQDETGAQSAKLSGRAMLARRQNQELGTSDYLDNMGDGIVLTAQIIMGMARVVYDTPRLLRILDGEEKEREILIAPGGQTPEAMALVQQNREALKDMLDPSIVEYDITVAPGRSHATARQETREVMEGLPEPVLMQIADLFLSTIDGPGMQEAAKRLKRANPNAQEDEPGTVPIAQAQQAQQMIDALTEQVNTLHQQLEQTQRGEQTKIQIAEADAQTKLEIERMKLETEREIEAAKLELERLKIQADLHKATLQHEQARAHALHDAAHERGMAAMGHVHGQEAAEHAAALAPAEGQA